MIGANEANQIMHIDRYLEERLKLDYWWMDAGWYIQKQGWPQVGTWEIDPQRFPSGFRPISDHAHAHGVKTLVWFEPERVAPGTWLYETHPEWLLRTELNHPLAGMQGWSASELGGGDPCVTYNPTDQVREMASIRWNPRQLSFHPGPKGEYSVVRWTAPQAGTVSVRAVFSAIDQQTTTDVHLLHNGTAMFNELLRLDGRGPRAEYQGELPVAVGDHLDCVVGWGNGSHICDSTGLEFRVTDSAGQTSDAAAEFHAVATDTSPWSYGHLQPGTTPDVATFRAFDRLSRPGEDGQRLLNLGDNDARQWLTDHVDRLLTAQGIDLYRQDFNIDPLPYWRANDAPDRQGITENHHVTGYLAYWDELRRRHPNMLIDTCASGGRRNDLETLRRAVPLWRSDYAFEPVGHQCMTYGISLWIPYHGTGTVACSKAGYYGGGPTPVEPYAFWSNAAPSLGSGIDIRVREIDYDALRQLVGQWRNVNRFYAGDYYPLTAYSRSNSEWIAWQFHDPDTNSGLIQAFRRGECDTASIQLKLHGLDPAARYELTGLETPGTNVVSGEELLNSGLTVSLSARPAAAVITYRQVVSGVSESLQTITDQELMDYVRYLADDTLEGRATNTPGGTTAGQYLAQAMKQLGMAPGGPNGEYIQDCGAGCRNVLGILPGSDPALAAESVVVGAHYDHIGVRRSRGAGENASVPRVCNGANDNASGVAGVLEIAEAIDQTASTAPAQHSVCVVGWRGARIRRLAVLRGPSHRRARSHHVRPGNRHDRSCGRQSIGRLGHGHCHRVPRTVHRSQRGTSTRHRVSTVHLAAVGSPALFRPRHSVDSAVVRLVSRTAPSHR